MEAANAAAAAPNGTTTGTQPNGVTTGTTIPTIAVNPPSATGPTSPGAGVLPERGMLRIEGTRDDASVFAVGADAQELFTALAARTGLKLVVDDAVSRRITVNIRGRNARRIVDDIAGAYGLSAADVEGIVLVSEGIPRSPSSYLLSGIASVSTKYVDAANARNLLPVFLQDYVKVNSEQNAVVLSAPRQILDKFRGDVAQFDTPASQILVDLMVVELTDTTADQLGLQLNFFNAEKGLSLDPTSGSLLFRAVTNLPQRFSLSLQALEEKGKARVRANPRIATVSGRRASIFVGRQRYVATPIDNNGRQSNFIDAGVRLDITPYTGGGGQILVDVDAEVSTLSAIDPTTRLPEKSTRTASTIVRVGDGQTIVIGGLRQQESRDVRTRTPFLGSLPLIGGLFRSKNVRTTQSELVLFITPRTLSRDGHLPAEEEAALKEQFLRAPLDSSLPPAPPISLDGLPVMPSSSELVEPQEKAATP
jgi:type II secretory pathway component GspD/PulD (secretin)